MTRTSSPRPSTLRLAGVCAAGALLVAGGGYALTSAAFTATETVTGNSVGTATLTIGETTKAPVVVTDLLPGQTAAIQNVLTFTNDGTVPFTYEVEAANVTGGSDLAALVTISLSDGVTAPQTGTLANPPVLNAGSTAVGTTRTVTATVGLDEDAGNEVQGKTATFDVIVTAAQVSPN